MKKYTCPVCQKNSIPLLNKILIGPSSTVTCSECQAKLSVPAAKAGIYLLPFLLGALYTNIMTSLAVGSSVLLLGFALTFSLWSRYLPLIAKTGHVDSNEPAVETAPANAGDGQG